MQNQWLLPITLKCGFNRALCAITYSGNVKVFVLMMPTEFKCHVYQVFRSSHNLATLVWLHCLYISKRYPCAMWAKNHLQSCVITAWVASQLRKLFINGFLYRIIWRCIISFQLVLCRYFIYVMYCIIKYNIFLGI